VKLKKGDFVGRDALLARREQRQARVLSCMTLTEPGAVVMGKEPIWAGGEVVGYVTSAGYGFSTGSGIAYGYLPTAVATVGTPVEIEYFDRCLKAMVALDPLFDPDRRRLRT
jgi:glycine cleavage system aminomethyltransferase T